MEQDFQVQSNSYERSKSIDQKMQEEDEAEEEEGLVVRYDVPIVKNWDIRHVSAVKEEMKVIKLGMHSCMKTKKRKK